MKRTSTALIAVSSITWFLIVAMTVSTYSEYRERYDLADSAPQVSQVADEFLVDVGFLFVIGFAITAVCVVVALTIGRRHDDQITESRPS